MQRYVLSPDAAFADLNVPLDSQERLSFLTAASSKVNNPNSQDAYVYATVAVAKVKLELKDTDSARKDLDKSEKILDGFDSVETIVHAAFYKVNAQYFQVGRKYQKRAIVTNFTD